MIQQLSLKVDNKPGCLRRCVGRLAESGVNIKALEVTERGGGESGIAHLIVSDFKRATEALTAEGCPYEVEDVLAVEMDDRVGGLASILSILKEREINVRYMYAFLGRVAGKSLAVFSVGDIPKAQRALAEAGVTLVSQSEIREDASAPYRFKTSLEDHFGKDFIW
jgi:hypothetical protein